MRLSGGAVRRLTAACLTLAAACANAAGQNQPAKRTPALTPTDLARIEQSIGRGMIEGAERPLLDYAVARPNDPRALYLLGLLRSAQGRLEEAASLHRRVLALDPAFAKAKISLGLLAAESGRHEEARLRRDSGWRVPCSPPANTRRLSPPPNVSRPPSGTQKGCRSSPRRASHSATARPCRNSCRR
jgi:hypothetical protein